MKTLFKIFGFIVVLVIFVFLVLFFLKTPVTTWYISKKLGVELSIDKVNLSSKELKITGLKVYDYQKQLAMESKSIVLNYQSSKSWASPCVIEKFLIEDTKVYVECHDILCKKNNWTEILENVQDEDKEFVIRNMTINNLHVSVASKIGPKKEGSIDHLSYANISSKKGFPVQQVIVVIFRSSGMKSYIEDVLHKKNWLREFLSPMRNVGQIQTNAS